MDSQEITEELEHPGARNLLDSATLLRLAYNGSDGFPRVIPIGFYWNGNQIVVVGYQSRDGIGALRLGVSFSGSGVASRSLETFTKVPSRLSHRCCQSSSGVLPGSRVIL